MKKLIYLLIVLLSLSFAACSEDDDNGTDPVDDAKPWVGTWLSADTNVATILSTYFLNDSVRVVISDDGTVTTNSHIIDGNWTSTQGVYTVTESATGDIHTVNFVYPKYEQEGIMKITTGTPDIMLLEVVQTVPDVQAVPPTLTGGFGSTNGGAYGDWNIQTYVKVD